MKKKTIIPKGLLIPDTTNFSIESTYIVAPVVDEVVTKPKEKIKKIEGPTLKELKHECGLRNLSQSGTKKVLIQRLEDDDKRIAEEKIFAAQEENRIIREHKDREIKRKEHEKKQIRKQIQRAYNELSKQQTECNRLDELANKIRTNIEILKE